MMLRLHRLFAFSVLLLPATVFAIGGGGGGVGVSDGGHGVICGVYGHQTVDLLDSLEAEALTGRRAVLGEIARGDEDRALDARLLEARSNFQKLAGTALGEDHPFVSSVSSHIENDRFVVAYLYSGNPSDGFLPATTDYGRLDIVVQPPCRLVQLALRATYGNVSSVLIDPYYWRFLSDDDKVGLLIHEALHSWFNPESSTRVTRQAYIYLTAPDDFRERNKDLFQKLVNEKREQRFR